MLGLVEPSGCPLSREELTITCHSSAAQTTTNYPLQQLFSYLSLKIVVLVFAQYGSCFLLHIQLQPERLAGTDSRLDVGFGSSLALFFFCSCNSLNNFVALITTLFYFILSFLVWLFQILVYLCCRMHIQAGRSDGWLDVGLGGVGSTSFFSSVGGVLVFIILIFSLHL